MLLTNPSRYWLVGLTGLGAAMRWRGLLHNSFHSDEALFASWGRLIALWWDPLLQTVAVDKPPLLFYLQALFYSLLGTAEWVARLPNFVASIVLIPLAAVLAQRLSAPRGAAVLAAAVVAFSPLAVQFSASAFTDPLMTTLVCLALCAASGGRAGWAGLWLGLALATKYQALLLAPLILLCLPPARWRWLALGLVAPLAAVWMWEIGRMGTFSLWSRQMDNFGGLRLAWSWELGPRLLGWGRLSGYLLGWGWLVVALAGGWRRAGQRWQRWGTKTKWLLLFLPAYLVFHLFLAVPVWDRYLLPLMPLLGVALAVLLPLRSPRLLMLLCGLLLVAALPARQGVYPIGATRTADAGAAHIARHLQDAPYGTVLYDHWYSWHWRYQLLETGVYISWFPHPAVLVEDLDVFLSPADRRYLALPASETAQPVVRQLRDAGYQLVTVAAEGNIILYEVQRHE